MRHSERSERTSPTTGVLRTVAAAVLAAITPTLAAAEPVLILDASGDGSNALDEPINVAVDAAGNVFAVGFWSRNVFRVTPGGVITQIIDSSGDGTHALNFPVALATDASGNVFVAGRSGLGSTVFRIEPGGTITQIIDSAGDGTHPLDNPGGLAVDGGGNVFVSGYASHNVFRITPGGTITQIIDSTGDGSASLSSASGLATDSASNVYVIGESPARAFQIAPGGAITLLIDSAGDGANGYSCGFDIVVDGAGTAFASGRINGAPACSGTDDNVFAIPVSGRIREIIDGTGDGTLLFSGGGLAIAPDGTVIAASPGTDGVFRIDPHVPVALPILHYPFSETAGPTLHDVAGGELTDATENGSGHAYAQSAIPDGAYGSIPLSGTPFGTTGGVPASSTGEWLTAASNELGDLLNDFSVTAWVNPEGVATSQALLSRVDPGNGGGWGLVLLADELRFIDFDGAATTTVGAALQAGAWQHIAVVKSSSAGLRFYLNGDLVDSFPAATAAVGPSDDRWGVFGLAPEARLHGLADEIRVYAEPLSRDQIRFAAQGLPATPLPALPALPFAVLAAALAAGGAALVGGARSRAPL